MAQRIISLLWFFATILCTQAVFFPGIFRDSKPLTCLPKPSYAGCHFNTPCDPSKPNPCGCPHACCSPTKAKIISAKSTHLRMRTADILAHAQYFCIKKTECNQSCGHVWMSSNNVDKCGCGEGLECVAGNWFFHRTCRPVKRNSRWWGKNQNLELLDSDWEFRSWSKFCVHPMRAKGQARKPAQEWLINLNMFLIGKLIQRYSLSSQSIAVKSFGIMSQ